MSTRSTARRVSALQKDRSSLCTFTFADGRQCRTPRHSNHPYLCFFHARKEAQARAAEQLGRDSAYFLSGHYFSACDLGTALVRLFTATAQGHIKSRTASRLAYLGQVLVQTLHLAQNEYIEACGRDAWRKTIQAHMKANEKYLLGPVPDAAPTPLPASTANHSSPATAPHPVRTPAPQSAAVPSAPSPLPVAPVAHSRSGGFTPPTSVLPTPPVPTSSSGGFTPPSSAPSQPVLTQRPQPVVPQPQPTVAAPPPASTPAPDSSSATTPPQDPTTPSASPAPIPSSAPAAPQPPPPSGPGTLGNWNPPPHSGQPRRARRGPGRYGNLCPSRIP